MSYPDVDYFDDTDLVESYAGYLCGNKTVPFVVIIDEWDVFSGNISRIKKHRKNILIFCGIF